MLNAFRIGRTVTRESEELKLLRTSVLMDAAWYKEAYPDLITREFDPVEHYFERGAAEGRNPHPLFDTNWYVATTPDAALSRMNPLAHYIMEGARERRSPHPLFDPGWYLEQLSIAIVAEIDALTHYLMQGWRSRRSPHPLFDPDWYQQSEPVAARMNPLLHYVLVGVHKHRSTHPLFDPLTYLELNPEIGVPEMAPMLHYLKIGWREGRQPNRAFDLKLHLKANDEPSKSGEEPLTAFARLQWRKKERAPDDGRTTADVSNVEISQEPTGGQNDPTVGQAIARISPEDECKIGRAITEDWRTRVLRSGFFDASWYLKNYRDIARANVDPLDHFIDFGGAELRSPGPRFDARWYCEEYPEVVESGLEPLAHFLDIGRARGLEPIGSSYKRWCQRFDRLNENDRSLIREDISERSLPAIDLLLHVEKYSEALLENAIDAIEQQLLPARRTLIVISEECNADTVSRACDAARTKPGFYVISAQFSSDIPTDSQSVWTVIVSCGTVIREHGLYMFAHAARALSDAGIAYSDEDSLDSDGNRYDPVFKPGFSPILAQQRNYFGSCILLRVPDLPLLTLATQFRDKKLSIEMLLRTVLKTVGPDKVVHIPSVLFHNIAPPRASMIKPLELISEHALPTFTIIIPTRDLVDLLRPCIESIEKRSEYPMEKVEIIVVDNGSTDEATLRYISTLSAEGRARVIRDGRKFNFSRLNNIAARAARHEVLLFVNNDTVVDDPLWLRRLGTFVMNESVAAVGCRLLYPDGTIQHGGVILGIQGVAGHALVGVEENDRRARNDATRELSAVTGACLAIRRKVFDQLGGFDTVAAVAFNDVILCLDALVAGYRNIYIRDPLLIHFESKSRGFDDTPEKLALFQREARYARSRHNEYFNNDPYYNPNLSLQEVNDLAFPPRRSKPWVGARKNRGSLRVLFLSSTHELGHGVPVVMRLQAEYLTRSGHEVFVGGPKGKRELEYEGCQRVILNRPEDAAAFAIESGMDCVVIETPPFFSVNRWLGKWPRTLILDHGEPPAEFFPDIAARQSVLMEKRLCLAMASRIFAISTSVRAEGHEERAGIIPNGNSHLLIWNESLRSNRERVRRKFGWTNKAVVLNVCRFGVAEQYYKGVDKYGEASQEFSFFRPKLAADTVFVLCGKAEPEDVAEMEKRGLQVFANVTDSEMQEFYMAADVYANFSRWEGYNLGIGQALAFGLPVVASDIQAHRAFPIATSNDMLTIMECLSSFVGRAIDTRFSSERAPVIVDWQESLAKLEREIVSLCSEPEAVA